MKSVISVMSSLPARYYYIRTNTEYNMSGGGKFQSSPWPIVAVQVVYQDEALAEGRNTDNRGIIIQGNSLEKNEVASNKRANHKTLQASTYMCTVSGSDTMLK